MSERRWTLHGIAFKDGSWAYHVEGPKIEKSFACEVAPTEELDAERELREELERENGIQRGAMDYAINYLESRGDGNASAVAGRLREALQVVGG